MTQEEKELLVRDLCARLPYGVMCQVDDGAAGLNDGKLVEIDISNEIELVRFDADYYWVAYIDDIKPYLFPISCMTEEQKEDMVKSSCGIGSDKNVFDWYNKNHFDYRGLIPMGLAIEAPEGMYN